MLEMVNNVETRFWILEALLALEEDIELKNNFVGFELEKKKRDEKDLA